MRPTKAHPDAGAEGVSATACDRRHTHRSTEIIYARSGAAERHPKAAQNPVSGGQEGCLTGSNVYLQAKEWAMAIMRVLVAVTLPPACPLRRTLTRPIARSSSIMASAM